MKICYITHNYPRFQEDYSGFFIRDLAQALSAKGYEVTVLAPHIEGVPFEENFGNLYVRRFHYGKSEKIAYTGNMHGHFFNPAFAPEFISFFKSAFAETKKLIPSQEILHAHWLLPSGAMLSSFPFKNKILTLHGTDVRLLSKPFLSFCARNILRRYSLTTTVSEFLEKEIKNWGFRGKTFVVPMTGNLDEFINLNNNIMENSLSFVTVSRLSRQKNIETALRAMAILMAERIEFTYTIIGDGEDRQRLEKLSFSLGLTERVFFSGSLPRKSIPGVLSKNDVFILPSIREGFGISAVEAMLSGLVVVCAKSGALQFIVEDGKTGFLFDPLSHKDCARVLRMVSIENDFARAVASEGRKKAVARFSFSNQIDLWENVYKSELGSI